MMRGLRRSGMSIRQIGSIVGAANNTVAQYVSDINAQCGCGQDAKHQGWCSFRYKQTARRQQTLHNTMGIDPNTLPGRYVIRTCPICNRAIEVALKHKACWMKRVQEKRDAEAPILEMKNELKEVRSLIKKIEEITDERQQNTQH